MIDSELFDNFGEDLPEIMILIQARSEPLTEITVLDSYPFYLLMFPSGAILAKGVYKNGTTGGAIVQRLS